MVIKQNKIYFNHKLLFISFFFSYLNSCQNEDLAFIKANTSSNLRETRLGESNYYINLPDNFKISGGRGKEGQLGYDIIPLDTSSTMFGGVEIDPGEYAIGGGETYEGFKGFLRSIFLNKKTKWRLYQTETKYFEAITNKGDISAYVSSKNRNEIDSLIAIIATLTKK